MGVAEVGGLFPVLSMEWKKSTLSSAPSFWLLLFMDLCVTSLGFFFFPCWNKKFGFRVSTQVMNT